MYLSVHVQYINVSSFLAANLFVLAGDCHWFSPFVVGMGTLQWSCWNTHFLIFMVQFSDCQALTSLCITICLICMVSHKAILVPQNAFRCPISDSSSL